MLRYLSLLCTILLPRVCIALSHPKPKLDLLILGLGRVGSEVASSLLAQQAFDIDVIGTVLPEDLPKKDGIQTIAFCPEKLQTILPKCSHVLVTIPPPTISPTHTPDHTTTDDLHVLEQVYDNVVQLLPESSWIGILSTTGVYGHHGPRTWVNEDAALLCHEGTSASAFRDLETQWQQRVEKSDRHHNLAIFRCAGIYGSDSSALHTVYKRGLAAAAVPPKPSSGITNRIHVKDLARAVIAAMTRQCTGSTDDDEEDNNNKTKQRSVSVYNLADDLPESRDTVMTYAAQLLESINVTVPTRNNSNRSNITTSSATPSSTRRTQRRSTELKLVSNSRMKKELLAEEGLLYPTYVEGLQAILTLPDMPWS